MDAKKGDVQQQNEPAALIPNVGMVIDVKTTALSEKSW